MSNLFTYAEALEMALRIELAGEAFYGEALERAEAPEAQELFRFLREQERIHCALLSGMLRGAAGDEVVLDEDTSRFLEAPVPDRPEGLTVERMLEVARDLERGTVRLLESLRDAARGMERHRLERILEEERGQLQRLEMHREGLGA